MFEELLRVDIREAVAPRRDEAVQALRKIKTGMLLKAVSLRTELEGTYMTKKERTHGEVNLRSLKHFFFRVASL